MNHHTLQQAFIERGCLPHQAEFAANFFAPHSERRHWLVSAPGMGKSFVSATIVNHALSAGLARRILMLAPSPLLQQWQEMIRRDDGVAPVMIVDRRRLRELEDAQPVGQEMWPSQAVVLMSLDFAKQADVAAKINTCAWDLLVVDEVHLASPQTQRAKVLLDFLDGCPQSRVLMLQTGGQWTVSEPVISALLRDAAVTVWTHESVRDEHGNPLLPEVRMEWIAYKRYPEEVELLARLQEAVRALGDATPEMRVAVATLLQSASSSPFALEQRIHRIRQHRSEVANSVELRQETDIEADEVGMFMPTTGGISELVHDSTVLQKVTEPLLKNLEELPGDAKCEALVTLLRSTGTFRSPDQRACVLSRFVDTATYLTSMLQDVSSHVNAITGSTSRSEREQKLGEFNEAGGVLIATEAMSLPLPEVALVVFYDLPLNPAALETRIGSFVRVGRHGPIRIVAFTDEANALLIERLQQKIAQFKTLLSEQDLEQVLFPSSDASSGSK